MEIAAPSTPSADASPTLSAYQFALPPELIAQVPAERRDAARLLLLDRRTGALTHSQVNVLPRHLRPGDLLVVNDTRVIPARLFGRIRSGGTVELLLVRPVEGPAEPHAWLCLGRPARRLRSGTELMLPADRRARVLAVLGNGRYAIAFDDTTALPDFLEQHGELPLPPYIRRPDGPLPLDRTRYQTIFAAHPGAIAAPTAGLHFTDALLGTLRDRGIEIASLTLHVGPGTFLPVRAIDFRRHTMEPERCDIPASTAAAIRRVKAGGGRIVAVGTTTTRALESAATAGGVQAGPQWADRFITPGYRFRVIDALFTNFHLPGSTLLLLVAALAGSQCILTTYAEAIRQRYRFYSYGDAMLIQ